MLKQLRYKLCILQVECNPAINAKISQRMNDPVKKKQEVLYVHIHNASYKTHFYIYVLQVF